MNGTILYSLISSPGLILCRCLSRLASSSIKGGVSHNRLVDAIRSGSIVVASEMDSYGVESIILLGSNHGDLINRLIQEYNRLIAKYDSLRMVC